MLFTNRTVVCSMNCSLLALPISGCLRNAIATNSRHRISNWTPDLTESKLKQYYNLSAFRLKKKKLSTSPLAGPTSFYHLFPLLRKNNYFNEN